MLKNLESAGCMECMQVNACLLDIFRFELIGAFDFFCLDFEFYCMTRRLGSFSQKYTV